MFAMQNYAAPGLKSINSAPIEALQFCSPFRLDQIHRSILLFIHTVFIRGGLLMARDYEIKPAFVQAITLDRLGRQIVTTSAFQAKLEAVNHHWTLQQCNQWIRREQNMFMELATENGDNRTYTLRNMGYVR